MDREALSLYRSLLRSAKRFVTPRGRERLPSLIRANFDQYKNADASKQSLLLRMGNHQLAYLRSKESVFPLARPQVCLSTVQIGKVQHKVVSARSEWVDADRFKGVRERVLTHLRDSERNNYLDQCARVELATITPLPTETSDASSSLPVDSSSVEASMASVSTDVQQRIQEVTSKLASGDDDGGWRLGLQEAVITEHLYWGRTVVQPLPVDDDGNLIEQITPPETDSLEEHSVWYGERRLRLEHLRQQLLERARMLNSNNSEVEIIRNYARNMSVEYPVLPETEIRNMDLPAVLKEFRFLTRSLALMPKRYRVDSMQAGAKEYGDRELAHRIVSERLAGWLALRSTIAQKTSSVHERWPEHYNGEYMEVVGHCPDVVVHRIDGVNGDTDSREFLVPAAVGSNPDTISLHEAIAGHFTLPTIEHFDPEKDFDTVEEYAEFASQWDELFGLREIPKVFAEHMTGSPDTLLGAGPGYHPFLKRTPETEMDHLPKDWFNLHDMRYTIEPPTLYDVESVKRMQFPNELKGKKIAQEDIKPDPNIHVAMYEDRIPDAHNDLDPYEGNPYVDFIDPDRRREQLYKYTYPGLKQLREKEDQLYEEMMKRRMAKKAKATTTEKKKKRGDS